MTQVFAVDHGSAPLPAHGADNGRRAASDQLMAELSASQSRFLAFACRRVATRACAEDVLQDFNLKVLERHPGSASLVNARAWLYRVLQNCIHDHHRRNASRSRALAAYALDPEGVPGQMPGSDEPDREADTCRCLHDARARLDPKTVSFLERAATGESHASLAREAGTGTGAMTVRLHRARRTLRSLMDAPGCRECCTRGGPCGCHGEKNEPAACNAGGGHASYRHEAG